MIKFIRNSEWSNRIDVYSISSTSVLQPLLSFLQLISHSLFQFWHDCLLVLFKQVFDTLRTTVFILGMVLVFIGISLLAPDEPRGILLHRYLFIICLEHKDLN